MKTQIDKERFGPWALVTGASSGIGKEFARHTLIEEHLKDRKNTEEGEIMAQKKFLVTGATGDTGVTRSSSCWSEDMRCGHWPIAKMTARNGWKRWAQKWLSAIF